MENVVAEFILSGFVGIGKIITNKLMDNVNSRSYIREESEECDVVLAGKMEVVSELGIKSFL